MALARDSGEITPYAQLHVVQNPRDPILIRSRKIWKGHYLPFWPQPSIIPRDAARGDRFENVAYFGIKPAREMRTSEWEASLKELGLTWHIIPMERWHDYRQIDVVVAVRNFDRYNDYPYKPASKLCNAWHAGVPAILGREAAYRSERQSELDYLEVTSLDQALRALQRLRDDLELRHAMIASGKLRALAWTPSRITTLWLRFLNETVAQAYAHWVQSGEIPRNLWFAGRFLACYRRDALVRRARRLSHRMAKVALAARSFAGGKRSRLRNYLSKARSR